MRPLATTLLCLLPFLSTLSLSAAQAGIICDDSGLTDYLLAVIDVSYNNGLIIFEQLVAALSEFDAGFALLENFHGSQVTFTILAPTDEAFQNAGIEPPFSQQGPTDLLNLFELHTLSGQWTYDKLPQSTTHAIASTQLGMKAYLNSTVQTSANQAMALQQGEGGDVVVRMIEGNGTTWSGPLDLSGTSVDNLVILPIDTVGAIRGAPPPQPPRRLSLCISCLEVC